MRFLVLIFALLFCACGGTLSEEQRKQLREEKGRHEIRRVTELQLTEEAFKAGRRFISVIESFNGDSARIDSLIAASQGRVRFLVPGEGNTLAIEQQLIDAYVASGTTGEVDNVQMLRDAAGKSTDSLLYTKPVITRQSDGVDRLEGMWNIWLSRKALILGMDDE